jgi:hypothetical protein
MSMPPRRRWFEWECEFLRRFYPDHRTQDLAVVLRRPLRRVYAKAKNLGLAKSAAFEASVLSGRIQRGYTDPRMVASQFKKGQVPWSKGTKGLAGTHERSRATQFKKGQLSGRAAQLVMPIGSHRINADGYVDRKISDTPGPQTLRWKAVHRIVWEQAKGPIPEGHVIAFKAGQYTTDPKLITVDRLECISLAENMSRNTFHRYGPEVVKLVQLRGALTRQINQRAKHEREQDDQ